MRTTNTNSGADSKGVIRLGRWEVEGESYLLLVAGAVAAVLVFIMAHRIAFGWRLGASLIPLGAAVFWIRFFIAGRPPHFVGDWLEGRIVGRHFRIRMGKLVRRKTRRLE